MWTCVCINMCMYICIVEHRAMINISDTWSTISRSGVTNNFNVLESRAVSGYLSFGFKIEVV